MSDESLSALLDRAELCFEKNQFKMVKSYLQELDRRTPDNTMPDDLADRFNELGDKLYDKTGIEWHDDTEESEAAEEDNSPIENETCHKCGGTGVYTYLKGGVGTCYDCQGKGFQTEKDVVRVKNYWAYRKGQVQEKVQAAKALEGNWPF